MAGEIAASLKQILETLNKPADLKIIPTFSLKSVTSKSGFGVYASSDTLYKGAVFGRDSLEVAEDLMNIKPRLVGKILKTLASLQGLESNPNNEEESGKIVHEYRSIIVDGKEIDDTSMNIFRTLSNKWGGNANEMAYFGSIDSTPQFLRVLERFCEKEGDKALALKITDRSGQTKTMLDAAEAAIVWLVDRITHSKSGLLEFKRINPHGIANQVWKDSEEFYVHESGALANHSKPIASIEVQGLVYDALLAATHFWPARAEEFTALAYKIRDRLVELLWRAEHRYFALGTDYGENGRLRVISTKTANPAALLDTKIFDDLAENDRRTYISAIVETIMSGDFLTDAGIRSRALSAAHLVNHWDYHGSFVSWPKETYDIAKGLRRQGFPELAKQLENRLLNVCIKYRAYPEFVYVDGIGRVLASAPSAHIHGEVMLIEGTNQPERVQAWTVSAVIAIISSRLKQKVQILKASKIKTWESELESALMAKIPNVERHLNPFALKARYPTYKYQIKPKD